MERCSMHLQYLAHVFAWIFSLFSNINKYTDLSNKPTVNLFSNTSKFYILNC